MQKPGSCFQCVKCVEKFGRLDKLEMHYENVCKNDTNRPKKIKKRKKRKVSDAKNRLSLQISGLQIPEAEIEKQLPSNISLGDLVWAKLFPHPCWPGIVTVEPGSNDIYTQIRKKHGVLFRMYHVQFFEEPVQRSWLDSTNLLKFEGEIKMLSFMYLQIITEK